MTITAEEIAPDIEFRAAWRLEDAGLEADAIAFWNRLGILPPGTTPEARARELVALAYKGGKLVALLTAEAGWFEQVRARLAFVRGAVDPEHRRHHVGFALLLYSRALLERWSAEHPEERLAGIGAFIEGKEIAERGRQPYGPAARLSVVGFMPDGRQIRVSWFRDFRLD